MASKSARTIGGGVGFGLLLTNMKKHKYTIMWIVLFVAFVVGFYFVDSTQAVDPVDTQTQEIEDLIQRISELEEELANLKADFDYHIEEGNND